MSRRNQFDFRGLDPVRRDRLFFALLPDASAARRAEQIAESLRGACGLTGEPMSGRFHVSLFGLGDYAGIPDALVAQAGVAAAAVIEAPFRITFDRAASFAAKGPNLPLVLRAGHSAFSLVSFRNALGRAMICNGLAPWVSPRCLPHMTLLYDRRNVELRPVAPLEWIARDFVLVHSPVGRGKHIVLGRWPLCGADPA
jgi:RNA 2',3'-cyclic 3'-phosphodiesterase